MSQGSRPNSTIRCLFSPQRCDVIDCQKRPPEAPRQFFQSIENGVFRKRFSLDVFGVTVIKCELFGFHSEYFQDSLNQLTWSHTFLLRSWLATCQVPTHWSIVLLVRMNPNFPICRCRQSLCTVAALGGKEKTSRIKVWGVKRMIIRCLTCLQY